MSGAQSWNYLTSKLLFRTAEEGNTVATATVTPDQQQVLYLWEEDNVPARTEYTMNDGRYSDNPDFRPYLYQLSGPGGYGYKRCCTPSVQEELSGFVVINRKVWMWQKH